MDCTKSLLETGSSEINIKKSKFIGFSKRCENEDEAKSLIKAVSQDHAGADHFCWAYRISLPGREVANYSDGGEPHGSAGQPILGSIFRLELTDVAVAVIRYFGGVKLGIRGLIDAYGETALKALRSGKPALFCPGVELAAEMSYSQWNDFSRLFVEGRDFSVRNVDYSDRVISTLAVRKENIDRVGYFFEERRILFEMGEELSFVSPVE